MRDRRITRPGFRPCSACPPRSQAPFCPCTHRTITNRAEGTFGSLRYLLGGDRPSQTAHQALSPRIHSAGLEPNDTKGGISPVAPPQPEPGLRSLPPILRKMPPDSIPGCSKAARGLSVPWRVTGVFTGTTSSPSPWPRQCSSRYTIRAGRNLPDKEFRYLRTVIVTAAVYRGFGSELRPCGLTPPLNLPAPGRCHTLYVLLTS